MLHTLEATQWDHVYTVQQKNQAVSALEKGQILFFPQLAFALTQQEKQFLAPNYISPKSSKIKNISYNRKNGRLRGIAGARDYAPLQAMIHRFSESAQLLMQQALPAYTDQIQLGRTSFRPIEIAGRIPPSFRKDDTRLHVDAFPSSPNQGKRILRVFTNINPNNQARVWRVGEPFETVAQRFLPTVRKPWPARSALLKALRITRGYCTEYDYTMLQIHNNMKGDVHYQNNVVHSEIRFAPNTSWIVQTDHVSHAAMAGQHVLEQTFYLPIEAMICPELSPLKTLEKLTGRALR